jgi:aminopeptidase N
MVLRRAVVVVLVLGGMAAARVEAQRLPGGVRPEHYSLTITPDLKAATFAGSETIEVVLDAPARAITLNAAEIEFGSVKAYAVPAGMAVGGVDKKGRELPVDLAAIDKTPQTAAVTLDAAKEQATFTFANPLPAGRVTLEIAYTGILNDKLRGFYLSKSKTRSYGVTQFEATDARRAFPCFDEPALKATFDVSLVVDAGDTAISNTKMVSDTPGPVAGKHTVAFAATPKMSTYLVAWLVGDFKCSEGKADGVPIRACATPDKVKLTKFALDAAKWTCSITTSISASSTRWRSWTWWRFRTSRRARWRTSGASRSARRRCWWTRRTARCRRRRRSRRRWRTRWRTSGSATW